MHDIDNYRGITLTSNVYKVYSKVLEENIILLEKVGGPLEKIDVYKIIYSHSTVFVHYVNHPN